MRACLDDLVIALYVTIDDLLGPTPEPATLPRHGCRMPSWSAWRSPRSCWAATGEHRWLRFCYGRLGHLFPYLPNQPGYNKRLRGARWLLEAVLAHLADRTPSVE